MPSSRLDYDTIAEGYDAQPYRNKAPDPELVAFLSDRQRIDAPVLLDIACGTGNQLIANRAFAPAAWMVGVDGSAGMLRQARRKAPEIAWANGDAAALPLRPASCDFISCQFAFHHFSDKTAMLHEAFRVLRAGGRLVIYNPYPQEMPDWIYYPYFPEAQRRDLADFWPPDRIIAEMRSAGFEAVAAMQNHIRFDHDLVNFLKNARRRENNSALITLSDAAYAAGLSAIERDINDPDVPSVRADHLCFLTVRGDKPAIVT
jgi:ubiquinone/menaquinone biosynthesis C-methylase UbiE